MPTITHNGANIYYEEHGQGFPILTFAPAGLLSTIAVWDSAMAPIKPVADWSSKYRVIVMDQRNAGGKSSSPRRMAGTATHRTTSPYSII